MVNPSQETLKIAGNEKLAENKVHEQSNSQ